MQIKKLFSTRKRIAAVVLSGALVAGGAGIAAAYFSATGTGTGSSNVGHPAKFTVQQQGAPTGTMYPGHGTSTQTFDITNVGSGVQHYTVQPGNASIATTGGNIVTTSTSAAVSGCSASWFTATATTGPSTWTPHTLSGTLTPTQRAEVNVVVTMTNANVTQNTCQGTHPELKLHVGS